MVNWLIASLNCGNQPGLFREWLEKFSSLLMFTGTTLQLFNFCNGFPSTVLHFSSVTGILHMLSNIKYLAEL